MKTTSKKMISLSSARKKQNQTNREIISRTANAIDQFISNLSLPNLGSEEGRRLQFKLIEDIKTAIDNFERGGSELV